MDLSKIPGRNNDDAGSGSSSSGSSDSSQQNLVPNNPPSAGPLQPAPGQSFSGSQPDARQQHFASSPLASETKANAMIDLVIALFMLLMFPTFWRWASDRLLGTTLFPPIQDLNTGEIIPWPQMYGGYDFLSNMSISLYAAALLICGMTALLTRRAALQWIAIMFLAIATLLNAYYLISSYPALGLAPISLLATAFGAYQVWFFLQQARGPRRTYA